MSDATPTRPPVITLPELALVVLVGASGSGKSTFASRHFRPTEVVSSDTCRGLVSDDENSLAATKDAFDLLNFIASRRLAGGKLTVVDATNVKPEDRKNLLKLAREYHVLPVAVVFNLPERVCRQRNRLRPDRNFGSHVIHKQQEQLRRSLRGLKREGFRHIHVFASEEEVAAATVERQPLWNNRREDIGPFDIIGDVHGCFDELVQLLEELDYLITQDDPKHTYHLHHPQGRRVIFLGDLVDRGPRIPDVLRLVMCAIEDGGAYCVPGNHDIKLMRSLRGEKVKIAHGLQESLDQLAAEPETFRTAVRDFLHGLVSHYVFDGGKLVVAHAGLPEEMQGRASGKVREFALYGETTGETDEFGLPIRYQWANDYRGNALVVYGHTPVPEAEWLNRTINIDTGCVFGGHLTALRYPEKELVSVPASRVYSEPVRPLQQAVGEAEGLTSQQAHDENLDISDVIGKRIIESSLLGKIAVREENSAAALEVMSRYAVDPKWIIYLPPTMAPTPTSSQPGWLERPEEAFDFYRRQGVDRVVCEEKHMGSRAIVVQCRSPEAARSRFGIVDGQMGICHTRTGRRFFRDPRLENEFLARLHTALGKADFWGKFGTDWVCLDAELMPWSLKAQDLLRQQYAAVGVASMTSLRRAQTLLSRSQTHDPDREGLFKELADRLQMATQYSIAYRHYCWPVRSIEDIRLAPFHVLATEGKVHTDKDHLWHMQVVAELSLADPEFLHPTPHRAVSLMEQHDCREAVRWWEYMTEEGGEGMVVKPQSFLSRGRKGPVQPAVKCRGREYLRIIYGPEYNAPSNLERLRHRSLNLKKSLALREFALGLEALERFVNGEPLRRVHECVFAVLALESEPVDPRL